MKPYERCVKFINNVTNTLSDEQMTKIKVVDLDDFYKFVVDDFFS
jgi:intracellular sulfur oxidation DsrE/DsrF family protein